MNVSVGARERCQLHLLTLRHQIGGDGQEPRCAGAVMAATAAVVREVEAVIGAPAQDGQGGMLHGRLTRLHAARAAAIAAARNGTAAELRRELHRFEVLTSALWVVVEGLEPVGRSSS